MGRLSLLFVILILLVVIFTGSQIIPFYYYYYDMLGQMEAQAKKATVNSDSEIRQYLLERIKKNEIPIESEDDLKINRFDGKIVIELSYEEVFYINLGEDRIYDLHVFEFDPRVEAQIGK